MAEKKLPNIIQGVCEFCGVKACMCGHYKGLVDQEGFWLPDAKPKLQARKEELKAKEELLPGEKKSYNVYNKKLADIIVPHHNRHDNLRNFLNCIDISLFNVITVSGNSFGVNCNKGARIAETDKLIFCNDDIILKQDQLIRIVNALDKYDIVGSSQLAGLTEKQKYYGIGLFENGDGTFRHQITAEPTESIMPSGFCFGIKKETWNIMEGFNEKFKTGNEDVDFGIRAIELGCKMTLLDLEIDHKESQSAGRMDFSNDNEILFYKLHPQEKLKEIFNKEYKK